MTSIGKQIIFGTRSGLTVVIREFVSQRCEVEDNCDFVILGSRSSVVQRGMLFVETRNLGLQFLKRTNTKMNRTPRSKGIADPSNDAKSQRPRREDDQNNVPQVGAFQVVGIGGEASSVPVSSRYEK